MPMSPLPVRPRCPTCNRALPVVAGAPLPCAYCAAETARKTAAQRLFGDIADRYPPIERER